MAHADSSDTDDIRLFAASLAHDPDGIELPYLVLDHVATRHHLTDAVLVLHPGPLGTQVFSRGRVPIGGDQMAALLDRPTGLYSRPDAIEPTARAALAGICNMALAAHVVRDTAATDQESGLSSRGVIEASLVRAAAGGSRYGWTFTAVLLATAGDGSAAERWASLSQALRLAARVGDEMGVAGPGRALSILGNAGPDVVRPYVARVRAALSAAAGHESLDLHAATVTSPAETVDPEAIWSLLTERLDALVGSGRDQGDRAGDAAGTARFHTLPAPLELALRSLPDVVSVGTAPHPSGVGYQIEIVTTAPSEPLAAAARRAREHRIDAPVVMVPVSQLPEGPREGQAGTTAAGAGWSSAGASGNGSARVSVATVGPVARAGAVVPTTLDDRVGEPAATPDAPAAAPVGAVPRVDDRPGTRSPQVSAPGSAPSPTPHTTQHAPAPLGGSPAVGPRRVTLLHCSFDAESGVSEVRLSRSGAVATGRATVGPLAGGAQATLGALGQLGIRVPYYLVSAERAHSVPGEPVVVVLAPRRVTEGRGSEPARPPGPHGAGAFVAERIGVATGIDDVGASARATLSALNRYLGADGATDQ